MTSDSPTFHMPAIAYAGIAGTLLVVGLPAGYYAAYAFGLIRWQRSMRQPPL